MLVSFACCCEHRPAHNTALQNEPASANRPLESVHNPMALQRPKGVSLNLSFFHSIPCIQLTQAADVGFRNGTTQLQPSRTCLPLHEQQLLALQVSKPLLASCQPLLQIFMQAVVRN